MKVKIQKIGDCELTKLCSYTALYSDDGGVSIINGIVTSEYEFKNGTDYEFGLAPTIVKGSKIKINSAEDKTFDNTVWTVCDDPVLTMEQFSYGVKSRFRFCVYASISDIVKACMTKKKHGKTGVD